VSSTSHHALSSTNYCADVQNEYNGHRQIKQYVFKRQRTSTNPNNNILNPLNPSSFRAQQPAISFTGNQPAARASKPAEAPAAYNQGPEQTPGSLEGTVSNASTSISTGQSSGHRANMQPSITAKTVPRRFHLSRSSIRSPTGTTPGHIRGAKRPPAVFIERMRVTELDSKASDASVPHELSQASQNTSNNQHTNGDGKATLPSIDNHPRPPAPLRNVRLPSGKVVPWNADSATLAAGMQAYTLREIGHNLANTYMPETSSTSTPIIRARQVSHFKPKAPALRYHERHPEQAEATEGKKEFNQDEIMTDAADPDGDESGYVMDTYIRMPAEMFEFREQKSVGLLVLDSQPDIDDFYNDDSDSDSEIYDEEEDENGMYPKPFHGKYLLF
jgi:flagellar basal body rod protein FlgC